MTQEFKVGDKIIIKSDTESAGKIGMIMGEPNWHKGKKYYRVSVIGFIEQQAIEEENMILFYRFAKSENPKTCILYVGDKVRKISGYRYPGVVVAVFRNLKGDDRYVVECTVPEVAGMLHIYNRSQLEKVE